MQNKYNTETVTTTQYAHTYCKLHSVHSNCYIQSKIHHTTQCCKELFTTGPCTDHTGRTSEQYRVQIPASAFRQRFTTNNDALHCMLAWPLTCADVKQLPSQSRLATSKSFEYHIILYQGFVVCPLLREPRP